MKKLVLLLFGVIFGLSMNAQTSYVPNEFVFYDTTTGDPFVYDKSISTNQTIYGFSCAIAYDVLVSGSYLRFAITNDDFAWHIMRRTTNNYIDFFVNVLTGSYSIVNPIIPGTGSSGSSGNSSHTTIDNIPYTSNYIIRIQFNR